MKLTLTVSAAHAAHQLIGETPSATSMDDPFNVITEELWQALCGGVSDVEPVKFRYSPDGQWYRSMTIRGRRHA